MATQDILKEDLLTLDPKAFYLKHIVKSHNWYFSDYLHFAPDEIVDKMDFFKENGIAYLANLRHLQGKFPTIRYGTKGGYLLARM